MAVPVMVLNVAVTCLPEATLCPAVKRPAALIVLPGASVSQEGENDTRLPYKSDPVALNCRVVATGMSAEDGETVMVANGPAEILTKATPKTESCVAVTSHPAPARCAV